MFPSRREFLRCTTAGGSMVALGATIPAFLTKTAAQTRTADRGGARDTILVVVQLTGGNDGLNTVVPYRDDAYARARPTLRLGANQVLRIDGHDLGLHNSMRPMHELLQDRAVCIVQGVGYPNPTQSHFRSMDIWHAARTTGELNEGWIGRALRGIPGAASFHLADENEAAPLALTGAPVRVPSITSLQDFRLRVNGGSPADVQQQRRLIEAVAAENAGGGPLLDFVRRTANDTYATSRRLLRLGTNYSSAVPYPQTRLAQKLRLAAQLIDAGLGARLFYVSIGGFDTHAQQAAAHGNLLQQLSEAMAAFYRDMAEKGHANRILMMTFSEFGRRVRENGSRGTDHGTAAPMFLVGGRVRSGVVGEHPSLTNLDRGNLRFHTDFRRVYATILDQWLGVPSRQVLGGRYEALPLLDNA